MYKFVRPSMERVYKNNYGTIPANIDYPSKSVAELMFENCNKYHNYDAIKYSQNGITHVEKFDEYANYIELTAKMLKLNGVKKGDNVVVLSPFLPEEYHTKYAISALGAIIVPLHPHESKSKNKITDILKETKPKVIVCLDSCIHDLDEVINENNDIDESLERVLYFSPVDSLKKTGILSIINPIIDSKYKKSGIGPDSLDTVSDKFASFKEERKKAENYHGSYMTNVKGEDDYAIYYSSGTSGNKPSGAIHTNNSCNSLSISGDYICDCVVPGQKSIIVPGPFHCFGSETGRNTSINKGVTQLIIPNPKDLKALAEIQKKEQAEIHIYVPLIMSKMKESGLFDNISYLNTELFICGGGKLSPSTSKYWNNKLPKNRGIREGYGSTQLNGGICINTKNKQVPGTVGIPLPDYYFKLIDPVTGEEIKEPNRAGELYVSGPSVMKGILNNPNHPSLSTDEENVTWYKTNDIMSYNEDGWYKFIDRADDILNLNSGNLVNPSEIRNVLEKYSIDNSIIFNTNGYTEGVDRIIVCIEYVGDKADLDALKVTLQKAFALHLKKYEIPSEIIIFNKLPMNLNGKFLKLETKDKYFKNDYVQKLVLKNGN